MSEFQNFNIYYCIFVDKTPVYLLRDDLYCLRRGNLCATKRIGTDNPCRDREALFTRTGYTN